MLFLRSVLLVLLLATGLLVGRLPHPCVGDGAGHACSTTRCACVTTCSCQQAHARARALLSHRACGSAAALACHEDDGAHAFMPERPDPAVPPALGRLRPLAPGAARAPTWALALPASPCGSVARPPWAATA